MHYPVTTFDSYGAQQLPIDLPQKSVGTDVYGEPVFPGENIVELPSDEMIKINDLRNFIADLSESELIELIGGLLKEVRA